MTLPRVALLLMRTITAARPRQQSPLSLLSGSIAKITAAKSDLGADRLAAAEGSAAAPEFAAGTWINSDPLTLGSLQGHVVVVAFWTFACYNCRNTLPYVKRWTDPHPDHTLTLLTFPSSTPDED